MTTRRRLLLLVSALAPASRFALVTAALAAVAVAACGEQGIQLSKSSPNYQGAALFQEHCSGCHTLKAAGTEGSATNIRTAEYKDGPNFNQRRETVNCILYAIRNGGFSSGPMPQDIVTGQDAQKIAEFVARYSGTEAHTPATPQGNPPIKCPAG